MSGATSVRSVRPADAPGLRRVYAPFVRDTAVTFETDPPSVESMRERVTAHLAADEHPRLVCELDGVAGYAYGGRLRDRPAYRWAVETTVYVDPEAQRRSVGSALCGALLSALRLQGYRAAYAAVALPNPASVGFHEALGFERVGTFEAVGYKRGAWHDVGWYRRELAGVDDDPDPPTPTSLVRGTGGWRATIDAVADGIDR